MAQKASKKKCKMAVSSLGPGLESKIGSLARCTHFIVFEGSPKEYRVVRSGSSSPPNEKGPSAAQELAKMKVDIVITSTIGPRAFAILKEGGIEVKAGCKGTVSEAVKKCAAGKLKECKGATYAGNIDL
jgi:predicted Fe-Mo cluster-binding NifX family protein